jgi:hypothetical protein
MRMPSLLPLLASMILLASPNTTLASEQLDNVKFSAAEIALLKRLNQIQTGAGISSTMLKAAPFVQLFASPAPVDVGITIATNDWDQISASLKGLKKIEECKTVEAIDSWRDIDENNFSSTKTEKFFSELRARANAGC